MGGVKGYWSANGSLDCRDAVVVVVGVVFCAVHASVPPLSSSFSLFLDTPPPLFLHLLHVLLPHRLCRCQNANANASTPTLPLTPDTNANIDQLRGIVREGERVIFPTPRPRPCMIMGTPPPHLLHRHLGTLKAQVTRRGKLQPGKASTRKPLALQTQRYYCNAETNAPRPTLTRTFQHHR